MLRFIKKIVKKIKFSQKVKYDFSVNIGWKSQFEGCNYIYPRSFYCGNMGYGSYIQSDCSLIANIGRFTSIAPYVKSSNGIHPTRGGFVTTSPMFFSIQKQNGTTFATHKTFDEILPIPEIGNDCWIGEDVFICPNIKIGDGAVVYAGAVVTKNVPPYSIVGGVPAKIIRYRFDEETIDFLLKIKWWNFPIKWLKKNWMLLNNIEEFKETIKNNGIPS